MKARLSGFRSVAGDDAPVFQDAGPATRTTGHRLGTSVLASEARPDAVFCANDALALGLLDAARDTGLRVPADLAVVGFDDVEAAAVAGLTTVRVFKEQMGELALRLLAERLHRAPATARFDRAASVTRVATELVVRSTA
jgi:LacI family transcriptional regulator